MGSLADQIRAAQDLAREQVACPEWNTTLWVRTPAGSEREKWEGTNVEPKSGNVVHLQMRARLLVKVVEDEAGKPVFTEADVAWLSDKSSAVLGRLFDVATRLAGISKGEGGEEKKSSETTPAAVLPTA